MGYKRAIREGISQTAYDLFQRLEAVPLEEAPPYVDIAFALQTNANPKLPMSGIAIYETEIIKRTRYGAFLALGRKKCLYGKGVLPKSPRFVRYDTPTIKALAKPYEDIEIC